ncbi:MAG: glycoside hydrolase family 3 C-terminal domain-containing protein, partial [Bdellovibrionota bacterium]
RRVAAESLVLLKNEASIKGQPLLPFNPAQVKKIALLGPGAIHSRIAGGGSSMVNPTREISAVDAFRKSLPGAQIKQVNGLSMNGDFAGLPREILSLAPHSRQLGLKGEYFNNRELKGEPTFTRIDPSINFDWAWNPPGDGVGMDYFSVRWTGYLNATESGNFKFLVRSDDGARLFIDDKLVYNAWTEHGERIDEVPVKLVAGKSYKIKLEYFESRESAIVGLGFAPAGRDGLAEAVKAAKDADVAVVFAGLSRYYESEGHELDSISLPEGQDELIRSVAKVNPNTVVVMTGGNALLMPWIKDVKAVVYAWYPGQEGTLAIADAILGKTNFSGKLPVSISKRWEDSSAFGHYPEDPGHPDQLTYGEGIYVGYRHFDTHNVEPLFPFGHGLSYTSFAYGNPSVNLISGSVANPQAEVEFDVTNSGATSGSEVAQLYVRPLHSLIDRPFQELKGFERVELKAGETRRVKLKLNARSFAYYDIGIHNWRVDPGQFELRIGGSSRDIRLTNVVGLR